MIYEIISKYHLLSVRDTHHRFKSWEHCNNFFIKHKGNLADENLFDNSCLQLAFYLASWGMMRGGTFLLKKDYKIHKYFIENVVMNDKYKKYYSSMQGLPINNEDIEGLNTLIDDTIKSYEDNIKMINGIKAKVSVTDTLASKILLGVYGIVPAYDRYFVEAMKIHGFKNTKLCEDSIKDLVDFYYKFESDFEKCRMLFKKDGINYPPMKLIDMYFWQVGYMLANPKKFLKEELQGICEFVRKYSQKINPVSKFQSREKCVSLSKDKDRVLGLKEEISSNKNSLLANSNEKGISSREIQKTMNFNKKIELPKVFRQRNIFVKVIPTVCNLKNMLNKLEENNWEFEKLKPWEKRSYESYKIDNVINELIQSKKNKRPSIIKENILKLYGDDIGASCIDIYLVGFVSEEYGIGIEHMFNLVKDKSISEKLNSAKAIYTVGKGDGIYLDLLYSDGKIKDLEFFHKWII